MSSYGGAPSSLDEIDITSLGHYEQFGYPYAHWAYLRRHAPVYRYEREGIQPFWAITKYHDIQRVSRDPRTFSNQTDITIAPDGEQRTGASGFLTHHLLDMDPPEHGEYRALVNRRFTPRGLEILEQRVDQLAEGIVDRAASELVEGVARRGEAEFVADVAARLPLAAICELLGVPRDRWADVFQWTNETLGASDPQYQRGRTRRETAIAGSTALFGYFTQLVAEKRAQPGDDVLTTLTQSEIDGQPLPALDILSYAFILILGGNETTRNAVSGGLLALVERPEQMQRLRADRSLLKSAVEEMLRWSSPIVHFGRLVTEDTEIGGVTIPAGAKLVMWYPSGNRDEEVFERPDEFDIRREPNEHLAFGGFGEHLCLGANLARLEMRCLFSHILDRLTDIELTGDVERLRSGFVGGIKRLPIAFHAA